MLINEVVILSTTLPAHSDTEIWQKYLSWMPADIKMRINRLAKEEDRLRLLLGRLLLMDGLERLGLARHLTHKVRYSPFQKPFLKGEIQFNIAHSGKVVLCALSRKCVLGIDVEKIRQIDMYPYFSTFNSAQTKGFFSASCQHRYFFKLWTLKESVIKAVGSGLTIPLNQIETDFKIARIGSNNWFVYPVSSYPHYYAHLACEKDVSIIQEEVNYFK